MQLWKYYIILNFCFYELFFLWSSLHCWSNYWRLFIRSKASTDLNALKLIRPLSKYLILCLSIRGSLICPEDIFVWCPSSERRDLNRITAGVHLTSRKKYMDMAAEYYLEFNFILLLPWTAAANFPPHLRHLIFLFPFLVFAWFPSSRRINRSRFRQCPGSPEPSSHNCEFLSRL